VLLEIGERDALSTRSPGRTSSIKETRKWIAGSDLQSERHQAPTRVAACTSGDARHAVGATWGGSAFAANATVAGDFYIEPPTLNNLRSNGGSTVTTTQRAGRCVVPEEGPARVEAGDGPVPDQ
jgi:hypothetical protein